jgi:hypothetical protein
MLPEWLGKIVGLQLIGIVAFRNTTRPFGSCRSVVKNLMLYLLY